MEPPGSKLKAAAAPAGAAAAAVKWHSILVPPCVSLKMAPSHKLAVALRAVAGPLQPAGEPSTPRAAEGRAAGRTVSSVALVECGAASQTDFDTVPDCRQRLGIDYLRHPVAAYGRLPTPLRQMLRLPTPIRHIVVAARPTMDPSGEEAADCRLVHMCLLDLSCISRLMGMSGWRWRQQLPCVPILRNCSRRPPALQVSCSTAGTPLVPLPGRGG
jgi:hypothetical protein